MRASRKSCKTGKAAVALPSPFGWYSTFLLPTYWSNLVINCCDWLACDRAAMPVWLRIWNFDMSEVAWP